jgi:hypothetical protein
MPAATLILTGRRNYSLPSRSASSLSSSFSSSSVSAQQPNLEAQRRKSVAMPFEGIIDWPSIVVDADPRRPGQLLGRLLSMGADEVRARQRRLERIAPLMLLEDPARTTATTTAAGGRRSASSGPARIGSRIIGHRGVGGELSGSSLAEPLDELAGSLFSAKYHDGTDAFLHELHVMLRGSRANTGGTISETASSPR